MQGCQSYRTTPALPDFGQVSSLAAAVAAALESCCLASSLLSSSLSLALHLTPHAVRCRPRKLHHRYSVLCFTVNRQCTSPRISLVAPPLRATEAQPSRHTGITCPMRNLQRVWARERGTTMAKRGRTRTIASGRPETTTQLTIEVAARTTTGHSMRLEASIASRATTRISTPITICRTRYIPHPHQHKPWQRGGRLSSLSASAPPKPPS
jgi:hypothetical protein